MKKKFNVPKARFGGFAGKLIDSVSAPSGRVSSNEDREALILQRAEELKRLRDNGSRPDLLEVDDNRILQIAEAEIRGSESDQIIANGTESVGNSLAVAGSITDGLFSGDESTAEIDAFADGAQAFGTTLANTGNPLLAAGAGVVGAGIGLATGEQERFKKREFDRRSAELKRFNVPVNRSTGIFAKKGGEITDNDDATQSFIPIQTEKIDKGEVMVDLDSGAAYDTHADKPHGQMKKNEVTDIGPEGAYIMPERNRLNTKDLKVVVGTTEGHYSEERKENVEIEKVTIGDYIRESGERISDAARRIRRMHKVIKTGEYNELDMLGNEENLESRRAPLAALAAINDGKNNPSLAPVTTDDDVLIFMEGGLIGRPETDPEQVVFESRDGSYIITRDPNGVFRKKDSQTGVTLNTGSSINGVDDGRPAPGLPPLDPQPEQQDEIRRVAPVRDISSIDISSLRSNQTPEDRINESLQTDQISDPFAGVLDDQIGQVENAIQDNESSRVDTLGRADNFFNRENARNSITSIARALGNQANETELKPRLRKHFDSQGLRPQEIQAAQEQQVNAGFPILRELNENGQDATEVLTNEVINRLLSTSGDIGRQAVTSNAQIEEKNANNRVEVDNFNNQSIVDTENINTQRRNAKINSAIDIFTDRNVARNATEANRISTESSINRSFDARNLDLSRDLEALKGQFRRNEINEEQLKIELEKLKQLQSILDSQ